MSIAIAYLPSMATVHAETPTSGTVPFVLEDNRVWVELPFVLPDGGVRKAWTFVDIGTSDMVVSTALYNNVHLDRQKHLTFQIGDLPVQVRSEAIVKSDGFMGFARPPKRYCLEA